jgi:Zn-dependent metalloprotease
MRPLLSAPSVARPCLLAVSILCAAAPGFADDAASRARTSAGGAVGDVFERVITSPATGNPEFVRLNEDHPSPKVASSRRSAMDLLTRHARFFGLADPSDELQWLGNRPDPTGGTQTVFRQVYRGVPVFGSLVRVHLRADGTPATVNGVVVSDIDLDPVPRLDAHVAEAVAARLIAKQSGRNVDRLEVSPAVLLVYRENLVRGFPGDNHLAWEVEVVAQPDLHEVLYLDAYDGRLLDRRSEIHRLVRTIHIGRYPNPIWSEDDPLPYASGNPFRDGEVNELIDATGDTHALFANLTGGQYLSFDGLDATMNAVYDSDSIDCPNAVESGGITAYCEGMVSDDVTAHEWTHAYTGWTHGLIYQWQPGALNEAYSDIYGELVDQLNGRGTDTPGEPRPPDTCSNAGGSPRPTLVVDDPPSIAGPFPAGGAVFNPEGPWSVAAVVARVDDGVGVPSDACEAINGFPAGSIALIDRGTCFFRDKVLRADQAGAVGVIIVNNQGDDVIEMGGDLPRLEIPAVFVGQTDGQRIKDALDAGVTATLALSGDFTESVRWLIGEDTEALGAIRDMWAPSCFGDPGRVGSVHYFCSDSDNGGVHTNSGVANHAFALLVDGGTSNGHQIRSIGATKAARIYWRAMTRYQTPVTGFSNHADLLEASCEDLIGAPLFDLETGAVSPAIITAADCGEVAVAMNAVEMRRSPDQCGFDTLLDPDPPQIDGTVVLLDETFDSDPGSRWQLANSGVFPEYEPRDWVWTDELPPGGDGGGFFAIDSVLIGDCRPGSDDQSGVMELTSPVVDIPIGTEDTILSFDHWMASEALWDGGNLKLSVNGGPFLEISRSRFLFNPYNDRINAGNSNPLKGEWAFTGTDQGAPSGSWGQSQIDLGGLVSAGDRFAIRFDFGVDGCNGAVGWYVDNVRVAATALSPRSGGRRVRP